MKVYRGPGSRPFSDNSHEFVSRVQSHRLEESIRDKKYLRFNITKDGVDRHSDCTLVFEDSDIIPMISGLLSLMPKLQEEQNALSKIKKVMDSMLLDSDEKITELRKIMNEI